MKKKCLLLFGAVLLYMALFSANASATTYISSAEQLMAITDMSETYILSKDIDLKGKAWTALGGTTDDTCFAGVFNGNGHTISSLTGKNGLFAMSTGTVKNVTLDETCVISGSSGLYAAGIVGYNKGTIENCRNYGSVSSSLAVYTGGICGRNYNGTIRNCVNTGAVKAEGMNLINNVSEICVGGICGAMSGTTSTVEKCWNGGRIVGNSRNDNKSIYVGGIAGTEGSSNGNNTHLISDTYNCGEVVAMCADGNACAGGIVGKLTAEEIRNSYNVGYISASNADSADAEYCFAIAGLNLGVNQYSPKGVYTNCYYLSGCYKTLRTRPDTTTSTAYSADKLKVKENFGGFNFTSVWMIDGGGSYQYPVLRANHTCSHSYSLRSDTATCAAAGRKTYICAYCGGTKSETSPALGHIWGDWEKNADPTYTCAGTESRICERCSGTEERDIAPTGQAVVDAIPKTQSGNSVTLENVPADLLVLGAAYEGGKLVFVQILQPGAGSGAICVPEDTAWDRLTLYFLGTQHIPAARAEEYFPAGA